MNQTKPRYRRGVARLPTMSWISSLARVPPTLALATMWSGCRTCTLGLRYFQQSKPVQVGFILSSCRVCGVAPSLV